MIPWILVRRLWWTIPLVGLAAALLTTRATLARVKVQRDAAAMKLVVTTASLDRLSAEMNRVMAEQRALADGDRARMNASRDTLDIAEVSARARRGVIDRLNRSAAAPAPPDCRPSAAVREVWK